MCQIIKVRQVTVLELEQDLTLYGGHLYTPLLQHEQQARSSDFSPPLLFSFGWEEKPSGVMLN